MKQSNAANLANTTAVVLLLLASLVFHVQRALGVKKEGALPIRNVSFRGLTGGSLIPLSFPSMLLVHENFTHNKPIQHA